MDAAGIIEWVTRFGFEHFNYYPGLYRGIVVRVDDPQQRGRIQARCLQVGHVDAPEVWIPPAVAGAGIDRGCFWPPEVGDTVHVSFQNGKPGRPQCYFGGYYGYPNNASEAPSEFAYTNDVPQTRGFVTRGGHRLLFKDTPGEESIELIWHKPASALQNPVTNRRLSGPADGADTPERSGDTASLKLLPNGNVVITDKSGQVVTLDAENGNVTVTSDDIRLGHDADTSAMRHTEWEKWAANHTHNTAWGPSDKPIVPPPASIKSQKVTLK